MKRLIFTIGILGLASSTVFGATATTLLKDNGCMECHNIRGMKKAPAFTGIARRNLRRNSYEVAKGIIIDSIKNGSSGKFPNFSDTKMPAFDYLSNQDLETIADYILSLGSQGGRGKGRGRGAGGGGMGRGMM